MLTLPHSATTPTCHLVAGLRQVVREARRRRAGYSMLLYGVLQVRYIDPTYMVRTTTASSQDHMYAKNLAHAAVDAAFAGKGNAAAGEL